MQDIRYEFWIRRKVCDGEGGHEFEFALRGARVRHYCRKVFDGVILDNERRNDGVFLVLGKATEWGKSLWRITIGE